MTTPNDTNETSIEVQRHGTMYLISSVGITLIGFLATMFYAHWVGAGVLGQYFLFLSYFAIAGLFTDLGIGYAATYRICEGKDPNEYFTASVVLRLFLWLIVAVVMLVFSNYFGTLGSHSCAGNFNLDLVSWHSHRCQQPAGSCRIGQSNRQHYPDCHSGYRGFSGISDIRPDWRPYRGAVNRDDYLYKIY